MTAPTSYRKHVKSPFKHIRGTKPSLYNNQRLVSIGIPSLDAVLGGGLAVGSVMLVEDNAQGRYAELIAKHFCAEGIISCHSIQIVSAQQDMNQFVQTLPSPVNKDVLLRSNHQELRSVHASGHSGADGVSCCLDHSDPSDGDKRLPMRCCDDSEKMVIAWRYQNQPKFQPAFVGHADFGHFFSLSQYIEKDIIDTADVVCVNVNELNSHQCRSSMTRQACNIEASIPGHYDHTLDSILQHIERGRFSTSHQSDNRNVLRIVVHDVGSPLWGEYEGFKANDGFRLPRFLLALRSVLRASYSVCLITLPLHDWQDGSYIRRLEYLCDTVIRLECFAASDGTRNPAFKQYTGRLHLVRLACLNSLLHHVPDTSDLAFRLHRRKLSVEKLHMPPDLSDTVSRQPTTTATQLHQNPVVSCGVVPGKSSLIDF